MLHLKERAMEDIEDLANDQPMNLAIEIVNYINMKDKCFYQSTQGCCQ